MSAGETAPLYLIAMGVGIAALALRHALRSRPRGETQGFRDRRRRK